MIKPLHFIAYDGEPVGVARVRFPEDLTKAKLERFAVILSFRKKGVGREIVTFIEKTLITQGVKRIYIDAQQQAQSFYEKLGYRQEGNVFEEVGIPHVKIIKTLV